MNPFKFLFQIADGYFWNMPDELPKHEIGKLDSGDQAQGFDPMLRSI
jgi:hypothetical protein